MKVKTFKEYNHEGFPYVSEEIDCYSTEMCFGEKYYLCTYKGLFLPIKGKDIREIQDIEILEDKRGQLTFNF